MNKLESKLRAFIDHVRPRWESTEMSMAITLLEDVANEIESMKAKNAELDESLHYATGTANLALKHRDMAEEKVKEIETENARLIKEGKRLWGLLDDISTFDGVFKTENEYFKAINEVCKKRYGVFYSDGCNIKHASEVK